MNEAFARDQRAAHSTPTAKIAPRRRRRHHEAVIEAEVRRLARAQTDSRIKAHTLELYESPEQLPAA